MYKIDKLDRAILNELQHDASISLKILAERVHSTITTCQRRIQIMQEQNIIVKQIVVVNPEAVGRPLSIFVTVQMDKQNTVLIETFEKLMEDEDLVMSCFEVSGDFDYVLLVHAKSMDEYHAFTRRSLNTDNNVREFKSQFVMNYTKTETKIHL